MKRSRITPALAALLCLLWPSVARSADFEFANKQVRKTLGGYSGTMIDVVASYNTLRLARVDAASRAQMIRIFQQLLDLADMQVTNMRRGCAAGANLGITFGPVCDRLDQDQAWLDTLRAEIVAAE